jgi:hypothetical protein
MSTLGLTCLNSLTSQVIITEAKQMLHLISQAEALSCSAPEILKLSLTAVSQLTQWSNLSWEASRSFIGKNISHGLWTWRFITTFTKGSLLDLILGPMNPLHILTLTFLKTNFNIILQSTPRSPKLPLTFWLPTKILHASISHASL